MNRFRRILWSRSPAWRGVLVVVVVVTLVLACLVGTSFALSLTLDDEGKLTDVVGEWKDVAAIAQSVVTVVAIVVGGYFAYYKLQLFRELEPHLSITHDISHRFIGDSYVHIAVTANIYNSSRVMIELGDATSSLLMIGPTTDADVERLYGEMFVERTVDYLQWPTLDRIERTWFSNQLTIEPGERHRETYEFIVEAGIDSVIVYTYFSNLNASQGSELEEGWSETTVYDIIVHE